MSRKRLSLIGKFTAAVSAIAGVILVACVVCLMEFRSMNSYVSESVADNIRQINMVRNLSAEVNNVNLDILTVIGVDSLTTLPPFDADGYSNRLDTLKQVLRLKGQKELADSVKIAYVMYCRTARQLPRIVQSNFIDTREWYFSTLQPKFLILNNSLKRLNEDLYQHLRDSSLDFDQGIFRSMIPTVVAMGAGILLLLMLLFYLILFYANPVRQMLSKLQSFKSVGKKYTCEFEGDDELSALNEEIKDLAEENTQLRRRISSLKNSRKSE